MRIMLDTNVLISSIIFKSKIMNEMLATILKDHRLVLSSFVINELKDVVQRKFEGRSADLENLEIQKDSFIGDKLKETFSDMLFKTTINHKEGYFYFLFEHKSYHPSRNVALQLLSYMVSIWEQKLMKEDSNWIPVIIPMIIYHVKETWKIKDSLGEMIHDYDSLPEEVKLLTPDFRYLLHDLSKFSDEDIKVGSRDYIVLSILKDINLKKDQDFLETIIKVVQALNELEEKDTAIQYFETCMRYILTSDPQLSKEQLNTVLKQIEQIYPEGSEVTMKLAEVFRNEGIEEGETRALIKIAIRLLMKKFGIMPAEYREKIAHLDSTALEILIEEISIYESIEDIRKFF